MFFLYMQAARNADIRNVNNGITVAWHTAVFTNSGEKLKPLSEYLVKDYQIEEQVKSNGLSDEINNKILRSDIKRIGGSSLPKMTWEQFLESQSQH